VLASAKDKHYAHGRGAWCFSAGWWCDYGCHINSGYIINILFIPGDLAAAMSAQVGRWVKRSLRSDSSLRLFFGDHIPVCLALIATTVFHLSKDGK